MNINAVNINKSYIKEKHELKIIRDFSCAFNSGEIYLFKGASGSGKTTLLSIFGLIDKPTSGDLVFDDISILSLKRSKIEELRRNKVGFVFQEANLLERLTIYENLMLVFDSRECDIVKADERIKELLAEVGLSDRAEYYPFELSGGEKQRVSFARAISNNPELLICDEPTASLDIDNIERIKDIISDMKEKGCIILISSHSGDFDDIANSVITIGKEFM